MAKISFRPVPIITVSLTPVFYANLHATKEILFDTGELESQQTQFREEMTVVAEMIQQCINENARIALDQTEYQKKYDGLSERFDRVKERLDEITHAIAEKKARRGTIERFLAELEQGEMPTEFRERLWMNLIDHVMVFGKEDVRFIFKDGTEIRV